MSSFRTDAELLKRAQQDSNRGLAEMIAVRLREDVHPSFDEAWRRLSTEGKPSAFIGKTASIGLGCAMMADGVYHIISGMDEQVEDLFLYNRIGSNSVRVFTGICELGAGSILAYLGAVKGPVR